MEVTSIFYIQSECFTTPVIGHQPFWGLAWVFILCKKKNLVVIALLKWAQSEYICDRSLKESPKTAEGSKGLSFFWKEF